MKVNDQWVTGNALEAWQRLLRANCLLMRALDQELQSIHGITLSDYDVLILLLFADNHSLRMSELSNRTLLTRSGMTRLIQGLEREGWVERKTCSFDARVSYAVLTPLGLELINLARKTHHCGIIRLFVEHFSDSDAKQLAKLLGQIPGVADESSTACCHDVS